MVTRRRVMGGAMRLGAGAIAARAVGSLAQTLAAQVSGAASLKAHAQPKKLAVGAAVNTALLRSSPAYAKVLREQYNIVVGENCMKWRPLRPTPTTYDFAEADELVAFAEGNGMAIRGHNLCWHESLPDWFAGTVTKENAAQFLTDHIRTVVGRYKGRIGSWDVVNEAIWTEDGRPDGLRSSSPWFELLGPGYLDLAFRTAREADPGTLLTYNDYGLEYDTPYETRRRTAIMDLLKRMRKAGTPIDAVGIQSHLKGTEAAKLGAGIAGFVAGARKLGLQVFLTEMDVKTDDLPDESTEELDRDVADVYRRYLRLMLADPAVRSVLTWGVADDGSWLEAPKWRTKHPDRLQRPLPFTPGYQPAPAFFALRDAIDGAQPRP